MEFSAWREWSGQEVAFFVTTFCDLPEYTTAIEQNISGRTLAQLAESGMLKKGLARAGICDLRHQQRIAAVVASLECQTCEELNDELSVRLKSTGLKASRKKDNHLGLRAKKKDPIFKMRVRLGEREAGLPSWVAAPMKAEVERPSSPIAGQHNSSTRMTPRPYVRGPVGCAEEPPVVVRRRLREHLASSLASYEGMRNADSPIPEPPQRSMPPREQKLEQKLEAKMPRAPGNMEPPAAKDAKPDGRNYMLEDLQKIKDELGVDDVELTKAAVRIQANFRGSECRKGNLAFLEQNEKIAVSGVRGLQQLQKEKQEAMGPGSVQAKAPRQKEEPAAPVSILDDPELEAAATKIQAMQRARQAKQETQAIREERLENNAAIRVQALYRGNKARQGLAQDAPKDAPSTNDKRTKEEEEAAVKLQSISRQRAAMREAEVRRHKKKEEEFDQAKAKAATKIQTVYRETKEERRRGAFVLGMEGEEGEEGEGEGDEEGNMAPPTDGNDIAPEMNDDPALEASATRIQAKFRQKQAVKEVEEKKEMVVQSKAATKIAAVRRGQQARRDVKGK
eukprot:gnl/TRDRNA2_/TRDRNA2_59905_c0_seq1.p1 gnl/TRDRNA2_/TRDRNA2_59905_c0~~gnl/TRDRNA2_/TRDRNA2_59905_c0_seq1.p1  ORF type:complete len:565 (+),score=146.49 gnl/TRDRNA2_/TRDRNA2_59905_c0_seq1:118-1812(+)